MRSSSTHALGDVDVRAQPRRPGVRGGCAAFAQPPGERVAGGPLGRHQETAGGFWDGGPARHARTQAGASVHAGPVQHGGRCGWCDQGPVPAGGEYRAQFL